VATYTQEDYAQIAAAVGKDIADVMVHQKGFENAALMFRQSRLLTLSPSAWPMT
jgi:hypothetical protein